MSSLNYMKRIMWKYYDCVSKNFGSEAQETKFQKIFYIYLIEYTKERDY